MWTTEALRRQASLADHDEWVNPASKTLTVAEVDEHRRSLEDLASRLPPPRRTT